MADSGIEKTEPVLPSDYSENKTMQDPLVKRTRSFSSVDSSENRTMADSGVERRRSLLSIDSSVFSSGPYPDNACFLCIDDLDLDVEATQLCENCNMNFCAKCLKKHDETKENKMHKTKDMAGMKVLGRYVPPEGEGCHFIDDCTICLRDGFTRDAIRHCKECNENLCITCIRWHHGKEENQSHLTYYLPGMGPGKQHEICPKHPDQTINKFCKEHDALCCNLCVNDNHSECDVTQLIEAAENVWKGEELKQQKLDINQRKSNLDNLLKCRKADLKRIEEERYNVKLEIQNNREIIDNHLDALEKKIKTNLDIRFKRLESHISEDIDQLEAMLSTLQTTTIDLQTYNGDNEAQVFINMKHSQITNQESQQLETRVNKSEEKETINFAINNDIAKTVCEMESLGEFMVDSATLDGQFNVKTNKNDSMCSIADSCHMSNGSIIMADFDNKKIKLLDSSYLVKSECKLPSEPYGLCRTGPSEVAISLTHENKIQFASVTNKILLTRSFKVKTRCIGLAYNDGELFVSSHYCADHGKGHGQIQMYNTQGYRLRAFCMNNNETCSYPRNLVLSPCGKLIHVSDKVKGEIITMNIHGARQWTYKEQQLSDPSSMCVIENGSLIVSDYSSSTIVQIDKHGQKMSVLLKEEDGIKNPTTVLFDRSRLIVTLRDNDNVLVYNLTNA